MSSETPARQHRSEKKKKKHRKEHKDDSSTSKKRKRDSQIDAEEAQNIPQPDSEPRKKKHKKDKKRKSTTTEITSPVPATTPSTSKPQAPPPSKKSKRKNSSPFIQLTTSLYLPLSPCAYAFPLEGLCAEHISPNILTYYQPLNGVLLSYSNPRLSEEPPTNPKPPIDDGEEAEPARDEKMLARSFNEYGVSFLWLTAEFVVFRPRRGALVEGWVRLQSESLLGLVCYNYFNAVVESHNLPEGWRWVESGDENGGNLMKGIVEGGGYFVDGDGKRVQGKLTFRVEDFEINGGVDGGGGSISIVGSLRDV